LFPKAETRGVKEKNKNERGKETEEEKEQKKEKENLFSKAEANEVEKLV